MNRPFVKMHGLGNDFVIIDALEQPLAVSTQRLRWIADRRRGIGCDQILVIEPGRDHPIAYRVFNADGSPAGQCGNGARCIGRYLHDAGHIGSSAILDGPMGPVGVEVGEDSVRVDMGVPVLDPAAVPFKGPTAPEVAGKEIDGAAVDFLVLSMGNPHAVIEVSAVADAPVDAWGRALQADRRFPDSVNVGFMEIIGPERIRLRVFERGVGETLACGSGACAAVVAGRLGRKLSERVQVTLPGGDLVVEWREMGAPVWLSGPAEYAYAGEFEA